MCLSGLPFTARTPAHIAAKGKCTAPLLGDVTGHIAHVNDTHRSGLGITDILPEVQG